MGTAADGVRESAKSWKEALLGLVARGLEQPPEVAIGDGAGLVERINLWKALQDIWPKTTAQLAQVHKSANFLNKVLESIKPKFNEMLAEIHNAEARKKAQDAFDLFLETFGIR
jgi:putative transposase